MRQNPRFPTLLTFLLLGMVFLVAGCARTGMHRAEKASTTMQKVESDLQKAMFQTESTGAALDQLTRAEESDLRRAFTQYSDEVKKMQDVGKQLMKHSDEMRARGRDYFAEWEKQGETYTNPEIRTLSEERRVELSQIYAEIADSSIGVKGNLQAYLTDIEEIRKYLSNDLTRKGVDAIASVADRAVRDGESLKQSIRPMMSTIARARAAMTPAGTMAPAGTTAPAGTN